MLIKFTRITITRIKKSRRYYCIKIVNTINVVIFTSIVNLLLFFIILV